MTTRDTIISWAMICVSAMFAVFIIVATAQRDQGVKVKYDCALLIGGWHPDFPRKVIEACKRKGINYDRSKTSYR